MSYYDEDYNFDHDHDFPEDACEELSTQCQNCGAEAYGANFCSSFCEGNLFYKREDYP